MDFSIGIVDSYPLLAQWAEVISFSGEMSEIRLDLLLRKFPGDFWGSKFIRMSFEIGKSV